MFNLNRVVPWLGPVSLENMGKVMTDLVKLHKEDNEARITLVVMTGGGSGQAGFGFYDLVRGLKLPLDTIGTGYVDSMGVILFLAGERRFVTPHTSMLIHEGRRFFQDKETVTRRDALAYQEESNLYQSFYSGIVQERTGGRIVPAKLEEMMLHNTVLNPDQMVELGIAHELWTP